MNRVKHGAGWTLEPTRRWFARCDTCWRFRLWADYFEVYPFPISDWWWECERCLLATATSWGEAQRKDADDGGC